MSTEDAGSETEADAEGEDPFEALREHEEALRDIGASNAPDAYVARIVLALIKDEDPDPADMERLTGGTSTDGEYGDVLGTSSVLTAVPPEVGRALAAGMLRRIRRKE